MLPVAKCFMQNNHKHIIKTDYVCVCVHFKWEIMQITHHVQDFAIVHSFVKVTDISVTLYSEDVSIYFIDKSVFSFCKQWNYRSGLQTTNMFVLFSTVLYCLYEHGKLSLCMQYRRNMSFLIILKWMLQSN